MTTAKHSTKKRPGTKTPKIRTRPVSRSAPASTRDFTALVERVVAIIDAARLRVVRTVNSEMVLSYWHIGREIVEFVQRGEARAEYGERVLANLSATLSKRVGRGYSLRNLRNFRGFYQAFASRKPIVREFGRRHLPNSPTTRGATIRQTASAESLVVSEPAGFSSGLGWSHYLVLSKVQDQTARAFYEVEAASEGWTVEHLERQIFTQLHLRLLKSRDKKGAMEMAREGQTIQRPSDLIKSPLVLDFLGLSDRHEYRESDLETAIISKLSQFLLELGKGFAFVARQKRLTFEDEEFFVDLVFYNVILKCYLLIDLKLGRLAHQDIGQMDSYMRLFDAQGRIPGDGPTIGLILCAEKNEAIARYSILNEHKQLFAAKYVTYLPTEEELQRELKRDRRIAEALMDTSQTRKRGRK